MKYKKKSSWRTLLTPPSVRTKSKNTSTWHVNRLLQTQLSRQLTQENTKYEASLSYVRSTRPAWATQQDHKNTDNQYFKVSRVINTHTKCA